MNANPVTSCIGVRWAIARGQANQVISWDWKGFDFTDEIIITIRAYNAKCLAYEEYALNLRISSTFSRTLLDT